MRYRRRRNGTRRISFTTDITSDDGDCIVLIVTADVTYRPARIIGPPEHCTPDESEVEIIRVRDHETNFIIDDFAAFEPMLEEAAWEAWEKL